VQKTASTAERNNRTLWKHARAMNIFRKISRKLYGAEAITPAYPRVLDNIKIGHHHGGAFQQRSTNKPHKVFYNQTQKKPQYRKARNTEIWYFNVGILCQNQRLATKLDPKARTSYIHGDHQKRKSWGEYFITPVCSKLIQRPKEYISINRYKDLSYTGEE